MPIIAGIECYLISKWKFNLRNILIYMRNYFNLLSKSFCLFLVFFANIDTTVLSQNMTINVREIGASANGKSDDTDFFIKAIESAYKKSKVKSGWREPMKIFIPSGHYIISKPILDKASNVYGGKFVFEGEGWQNTIIEYNPNVDSYLFDNQQMIGFTTFIGIDFRSNNKGLFMHGVGGGTGNAQSFIFEKCKFSKWETIISSQGNSMMSEVTFRDCKINGSDERSVLFQLNNQQAVNWRFISTDIESVGGIIFDFTKGCSINFYQGSIIPIGKSIVFNVNEKADVNSFGGGNNPLVNCIGVRFELKDKSKLISINKFNVNSNFDFYSCGMGGENITDQFAVETMDSGVITFINCENLKKFKFKHNISNSTSWTKPLRVIFINKCPPLDFMSNSVCNKVVNDAVTPIYSFINCGINTDIRPFAKGSYFTPINSTPIKVSKNVFSPSPMSNRTDITIKKSWNEMWRIKLPDVNILSMKLYITDGINYGSKTSDFEIKLTNKAGTVIFIQDNYSQSKARQRVYEWKIPVYSASSDEMILHVKPINYDGAKFGITSFVVLEY